MPDVYIKIPEMSFTPVDNSFIDNFIPEARGEFVKVFLLCLRLGYSNHSTSIEKIASTLKLLQADVIMALEYWEEKGILKLSNDGTIEIMPLGSDKKEANEVSIDNPLQEMLEGIEKLLARPMSSKEISVFLHIIEDFKFTPEMLNLLVEYCSSRKKTDIRYIEKVAIAWYDNNIKTYEDAQMHITKHEEKWNKYRSIFTYMGFKDSDISKPQEDFLEKWLYTYNFPVEVVLEACKICIMRINDVNFNYIDAILGDWNKNGVKVASDIKKNSKKSKNPQRVSKDPSVVYIGERQYDIDKLEKQLLGRNDINEE